METVKPAVDVLYRGEKTLEQIKQYSIVIMGLSRTGKSCTYNHIRNKPMVGANDGGVIYQSVASNDPSVANMGSSMKSITLEPNLSIIDSTISIIDTAGLDQNRSAANIIHVSYLLQVLFERIKKAKFILVFSQSMIMNEKSDEMIKTLTQFIDLFNFPVMSSGMKKELFNSVSFVITKTRESQQVYKDILKKKALQILELRIQNKGLVAQVINANRIYGFEKAKVGIKSPQSNILATLNKAGWNFFNFSQKKKDLEEQKKKLVILPFNRDFNTLKEQQKKSFKESIKKRTDDVTKGFAKLIEIYPNLLLQNWSKACTQSQGSHFNQKAIDNSKFIQQVKNFLKITYEDYKSDELEEKINFKKQYEVPLLQIIDSTLKIKDVFNGDNDEVAPPNTKLSKLSKQVLEIIRLMGAICRNQKELILLKRVAFVIKRTIEEYLIFFTIQESLLCDIYHNLRDLSINSLNNYIEYAKEVINTIPSSFLTSLFPNIPCLNEFQKMANDYMAYFKTNENTSVVFKSNSFDYTLKYQRIKTNINISKCIISEKCNAPLQSILYVKSLLYQLISIVEHLKKGANGKQQLKKYEIKKIKYTKKIADLIMDSHTQEKELIWIALRFSELCKCQKFIESIYHKIISLETQGSQKYFEVLSQYNDFLLKHNRTGDAIKSLKAQYQLYLAEENQSKLQQVKNKLEQIEKNKEIRNAQYLRRLKQLALPFNNQENELLKNLLTIINAEEYERFIIQANDKIIKKKNQEKEAQQKLRMEKIDKEIANYKRETDKKMNEELANFKKKLDAQYRQKNNQMEMQERERVSRFDSELKKFKQMEQDYERLKKNLELQRNQLRQTMMQNQRSMQRVDILSRRNDYLSYSKRFNPQISLQTPKKIQKEDTMSLSTASLKSSNVDDPKK